MAWHVGRVGDFCRKFTISNVLKIIGLLRIVFTVTGERDNIALRKTAYQSYPWYSASKAVDGNTDSYFGRGSCTHTAETTAAKKAPWWLVDLGKQYTISDLEITNRDTIGYRLSNFDIKIGSVFSEKNFDDSSYRSCAHYPGTVPDGITLGIQCMQPTIGRYAMVRLRGDKNPLTLCEVKVFAATDSTGICRFGFDKRCIFPCRCEYNRVCDEQTGACPKRCMDSKPPGHRWSGTGCLIGNVAYGKKAHQVGAYENRHASYAVDGKTEKDTKKFCSQPESENDNEAAWWYVDLNGTYAVNKVIVYNTLTDWNPLRDVTVRIGMTDVVNDQDVCDSYSGRVPNGHSFPCDGKQGRYVTIKRNGGSGINTFTLCEVLVIGHEYIDVDCKQCLDKTCPDRVTGCSICDGKQPPDCNKDCPPGFYGKNCISPCGYCLEPAQCDSKTGECRTGCMQWYGLTTCTQTIDIINMTESERPFLLNVTSSTVAITWNATSSVISGLASHYTYIVRAVHSDTSRVTTEVRIPYAVEEAFLQARVDGLLHNTQYLIDVRLEAKHYNQTRVGEATLALSITTECKVPDKPTIQSVVSSVGWLNITYKIADSGCDYYGNITMEYRHLLDNQWNSLVINKDRSLMSIGNLEDGDYYVRINVVNNLLMRAYSDKTFATVPKFITTTLEYHASGPKSRTGTIAGAVVAVIALLVILIVAILLLVRYRNRKTPLDFVDKTITNAEMAQIESPTLNIETHHPAISQQSSSASCKQTTHGEALTAMPDILPCATYENVTALNELRLTRAVNVVDLASYISRNEDDKFDFKHLSAGPIGTALAPDICKSKDRFANIRPYESSRVVLHVDVDTEDPTSDYINASFITGYPAVPKAFVASQGPKKTTANDMWRMVWQLKSNRIVMLTGLIESGRTKCNLYWPQATNKTQQFGHISVTMLDQQIYADFTIRIFMLKRESETRRVHHFQYTAWTDKSAPSSATTLLALRHMVRLHDNGHSLIVHCSAGVGRTGTYIAMDCLLQEGLVEGKVDIAGCVNRLRIERMKMVQTEAQYVFLHHALLDGLMPFTHTYACSDFCTKYKNELRTTDTPEIIRQYKELQMRKDGNTEKIAVGLQPANRARNRSDDIVPLDNHRPFLATNKLYKNNYINASYVDGYHSHDEFIVTQLPLTKTIVDFWRMVFEHKIPFIVTLDEVQSESESFVPIKDNPSCVYGSVKVTLMAEDTTHSRHFDLRQYEVSAVDDPSNAVLKIKQLVMTGWPTKEANLPNTDVILNLVDVINGYNRQQNSGPMVVQCRDGATRSGIVCAMCYCLMKMQVEQTVDIFSTVQLIRSYRKQLIADISQFHYLHQMAYDKLMNSEIYANVSL